MLFYDEKQNRRTLVRLENLEEKSHVYTEFSCRSSFHHVSRPETDLQLKATDRLRIRARSNRRTEWQSVLRLTAGACSNLVNRFIAAF